MPASRKALPTTTFLSGKCNSYFGTKNTIASVKGSVKKIGLNYQNALVVLYNKSGLLPIAARKPKPNGDYQFLGLNTELKTFVVAFDKSKQFNAVIQDNVVPK